MIHQVIRDTIQHVSRIFTENSLKQLQLKFNIIWTPPKHSAFQPIELTWAHLKSQLSNIPNGTNIDKLLHIREQMFDSGEKTRASFIHCLKTAEYTEFRHKYLSMLADGTVIPQGLKGMFDWNADELLKPFVSDLFDVEDIARKTGVEMNEKPSIVAANLELQESKLAATHFMKDIIQSTHELARKRNDFFNRYDDLNNQ
jgi:hypothetical protein